MELTPAQTRVLGCLLEKERTTPENYPLSLHALASACNQTTNRDPVTSLGEREIEEALDGLRREKLATVIFGAGSRVQKYRHTLPEIYDLTPQESALLCVLLLRGPQTAAELRSRSERLAAFATLADAESVLAGLAAGAEPLVRLLPARPGQKERRYVQLLAGEPAAVSLVAGDDARTRESAPPPAEQRMATGERIAALEHEVADLRGQLLRLQESFAELRAQLGG
jgi:uncharacterized protein YceH (UPF0502 family)